MSTSPGAGTTEDDARGFLVCRVGARLCGLPLGQVVETMRALPVHPLAGAPAFVAGVAVVRGAAMPVVDAARLLFSAPSAATPDARFVTVAAGGRVVALQVDAVLGLRQLSKGAVAELPPLFGQRGDAVAALGALDEELLLVLRGARLVPDEVWAAWEAWASLPGVPVAPAQTHGEDR
jgi:purine-binding chemotaxis protein CheW